MADWIHCNVCICQFRSNSKFYVTSCGHIICNKCVLKSGNENQCCKCNSQCEFVEICGDMDSNIELYFHPLSESLNKLNQISSFQQTNMFSFLKNIMKKYNLAKVEIMKINKVIEKLKIENEKVNQELKELEKPCSLPPSNFPVTSFANSTISKQASPYSFTSSFLHKSPMIWNRPVFNGRFGMQQRPVDVSKLHDVSASLRSDVSSMHTPNRSSLCSKLPMVHLNLGSKQRQRFSS